jgi:membrane protein CcdC involved in cytochrome C biogenesis
MKKSKGLLFVLLPVVITLSLCVVFYSRIECKPNDAGFWFILALGMSLGVALTRFAQWSKADKTDSK